MERYECVSEVLSNLGRIFSTTFWVQWGQKSKVLDQNVPGSLPGCRRASARVSNILLKCDKTSETHSYISQKKTLTFTKRENIHMNSKEHLISTRACQVADIIIRFQVVLQSGKVVGNTVSEISEVIKS